MRVQIYYQQILLLLSTFLLAVLLLLSSTSSFTSAQTTTITLTNTTASLAPTTSITTTTATTATPAPPTPAPPTTSTTTTPAPPTTTQPPLESTQDPQNTATPPPGSNLINPVNPPIFNPTVVAVYIDIQLHFTDAALFVGTSQSVWKFFEIFCTGFRLVPQNRYSCQAVDNADSPFRGRNSQNPTLTRPLVAARRFLSGQYVIPFSNNTYLMTLRFKGAHDVVQALYDILNSGSHYETLGIMSASAMPALDTIYDLSPAGKDKLRLGTFDTQLSITWHIIISIGTILVVVSLYVLKVRSHPEDATFTSANMDAATGASTVFDDLENPNENKRWAPNEVEDHRERLLERAYEEEEVAETLVHSSQSTDTRRGEKLVAQLKFGDPLIQREMDRNLALVDGALELAPHLKLPPDTSSPQYKRMKLLKRRRFVVLAKDDEDEELQRVKAEAEEEEKLRKIEEENSAKIKAEKARIRNDMTALGKDVNQAHINRGPLGLGRRRMAASMTTFADCSAAGRAMPLYKETEVAMTSTSPLSQRREHRQHRPELNWADLRKMQEDYATDMLAKQAAQSGMAEPTDAEVDAYERREKKATDDQGDLGMRGMTLSVKEIEEEVEADEEDEEYYEQQDSRLPTIAEIEDDDDDYVAPPPINAEEL